MKRTLSTLFGLAVLCLFAEAQAVPSTVSFTGRLTTSTGPVSGAVTVTFKLFDLSTNGTEQWSETRSLTATSTGLVYADLGSMTTLDSTILDNSPLFLEIHVGSEILTPRLPLQSVPYAIRSEVANTAETLGTIAPGDVVTTVNASGGISAARSGNTVTLTGTAVSGTAPIAVAGGAVSLTTCAANQVYKMSGGSWQCAADANTTYTAAASSGVVLNGTAFGLTTCANGQVLKAGATAGTWACGTDVDTNTTYAAAANSGVVLNGTLFGLTTCTSGQVLKAGATAGTWACGTDSDAGGDITGITTSTTSGLSGGCTGGTCTLTVDATDFNAVPQTTSTTGSISVNTATSVGTTVTSDSITVPTAGTIIAIAAFDAYCSACANGSSEYTGLYTWLTTNSTGTLSTPYSYFILTNPGTADNYSSSSLIQTFPAASAGTYTIYMRGGVSITTEPANVARTRMVLMFIPS